MKTTKFFFSGFLLAAFLFILLAIQNGGSIRGKVTPIESAYRVWAINGTDTIKSSVAEGFFEIKNLKQGAYTIIIDAVSPYKNAVRSSVLVKDGEVTDLGEIPMEQK